MKFTRHALTQMENRGISMEQINNCLDTGKELANRTDPENKLTFVAKDIYVVTDREKKVVITTFINERNSNEDPNKVHKEVA